MINIYNTLITGCAIILVIMIHELAHGFVALYFGDTTAKQDGRLSFNPLKHLDPIGTISLILFNFGWAKPVPVNFSRLEPKRLGAIGVSLAGCIANFITALVFAVLLMLQSKFFPDSIYINNFLMLVVFYSIGFGVFNLVPIPPLDGSKFILAFLPAKYSYLASKYERYLFILLMVLVSSGTLSKFTTPLVKFISELIFTIAYRISV